MTGVTGATGSRLPERFFAREDESPDPLFYSAPRFVTHIDELTIAALTDVYRERIPPGSRVLDLMSSWISHLPDEVAYERVAGLGMNSAELERNPRLDDWVVHDLNQRPELPYPDASFDFVLNAVSVQYLVRPVEVFRSAARVLAPAGTHLVATSHRLFPTKAILAWRSLDASERQHLVERYFELAGGYGPPEFLDRSPPGADPLWVSLAPSRGPGACA
jgi:SAM-dependent methyltransferase